MTRVAHTLRLVRCVRAEVAQRRCRSTKEFQTREQRVADMPPNKVGKYAPPAGRRSIGGTMIQRVLTSGVALTGRRSACRTFLFMLSGTFCTVVWALTCFRTSAETAQRPATELTPSYRIDLRSTLMSAGVPQLGTNEGVWTSARTLHFPNDRQLIATLVLPAKKRPSLATRSEPGAGSSFRLSAAIIDASSGKVVATPEWPSDSRSAGVVAVNENGLVTLARNRLTLLASDLTVRKHLALPAPDSGPWWNYLTTQSGRHVLFVAGNVPKDRPWLWLDTDRLEVVKSWQDASTGSGAVSDDLIVLSPANHRLPLEAKVPGGDWRPVASVEAASLQFVAPDLLYLNLIGRGEREAGGGVFLMRTDGGQVSRLVPPHKGWGLGPAAVSRTGKRFAIVVGQTKGSHPLLDIGGHSVLRALLVFDPPFKMPCYTLLARGSKVTNPSATLSPDGRHLAVLGYPDPILEVFELPNAY
jgi:hypothetical protein